MKICLKLHISKLKKRPKVNPKSPYLNVYGLWD